MSTRHRPQRVYSILIWGGWYGSRNIGDTAILLGIKEIVQRVNARPDNYYLRALSTDPDYTSSNGVTGVQALLKADLFRPWRWLRLAREFRRADLIVVSGGTPIFDFSHLVRTAYLALGFIVRRPVIFLGIGAKPIRSWYGRRYLPFFLKRADHITVRDEGSRDILRGLGVSDALLTADSGFLAPAGPESDLTEILSRYGVSSSDRLLVVAPRLMSADWKNLYLDQPMDADVVEEATDTLARAVDRVAGRFDRVIFMAMHYHGADGDVPLCRSIMAGLKSKNALLLAEELRPGTALRLFRNADTVLAMRLHAALLASSMNTPVVAVAYEQKVTDLMERLELGHYCADLFALDEDDLVEKLESAVARREELRDHLQIRTDYLRGLVLDSASTTLRLADPNG